MSTPTSDSSVAEAPEPVRDLPGAVSFTKTISEYDVYCFAGITGDFYPVHIDAVYAASQPVGQRIAHGAYVVGLFSTVAAQWMLKEGIDGLSYGYDGLRFIRPVAIGDTITVAYAVTDKSDDGCKLHARVEGRNQDNEVVAVGRHIIWIPGS